MSGVSVRSEYYWDGARLTRHESRRSSRYTSWASLRDPLNFVLALEHPPSGLWMSQKGPLWTERLWRDAILQETNYFGVEALPEIGKEIPLALLNDIRQQIQTAEARVTSRFERLSNEERSTGALFDRLDGEYVAEGWRVEIRSQGYSAAQGGKESKIGADVGILIDITSGARRAVKALWIQAKREEALPKSENVLNLQDLREQYAKMRRYTNEAYALIYSPHGMVAFGGDGAAERIEFNELLVSAMQCDRGDRSGDVVANTVDRTLVVDITITNTTAAPAAPDASP